MLGPGCVVGSSGHATWPGAIGPGCVVGPGGHAPLVARLSWLPQGLVLPRRPNAMLWPWPGLVAGANIVGAWRGLARC